MYVVAAQHAQSRHCGVAAVCCDVGWLNCCLQRYLSEVGKSLPQTILGSNISYIKIAIFPNSLCIGTTECIIYIYAEFGVVVIKLRSTRGSNCSSRAELARLESCNYCLKCWVIWLLLPQTPRICITSTVSLVAKIIVICVT